MLDSTPEEIRQSYGCLVRVGRFFIITTLICLALSIWQWFDGRLVALTALSLLAFLLVWWMVMTTEDEYRESLRRESLRKRSR